MLRLSLLVPTLAAREPKLRKLLSCLLPQAEGGVVEIVALYNNGGHLPDLRRKLLHSARGEFVAFIDDDDMVPDYYTREILQAITDPTVDYVGFEMKCTGFDGSRCINSTRASGWLDIRNPRTGEMVHYRDFNYVCPVRRSLVSSASFGDRIFGEDRIFRENVIPILRRRFANGHREEYINRVMYYYQWDGGDSTQTSIPLLRNPVRPVISHPCFRWCE